MEKEYPNEMRGALWITQESQRKDNGPIASGTVTVSGVPLRVVMWPKRIVDKAGSKAYGRGYLPLTLEYPKGTEKFLAAVRPANVVVTAATSAQQPDGAAYDNSDVPF